MSAQGSLLRWTGRWELVLTVLKVEIRRQKRRGGQVRAVAAASLAHRDREKLGWDSLFTVGMRGGARWNVEV